VCPRGIRLAALAVLLIAACLGLLPPEVARAADPNDCGTDSWIAAKLPSERARVVGDAAVVTDGVVARDGTDWDDASAVVLEAGGSITFDLGQPRAVSALFLQADANDRYPVSGSLVGTPGSFEPIAEFAAASNRGHGLQPRTLTIAPVSVRFVRIGGSGGDGFYSISEFSIHCRAPEPFPPLLTAANQSSGIQRPKAEPDTAASKSHGRTALLVLAGVLALVGSQALFAARQRRKKKRRPRESEAETATHERLRLLFLASGCAALIYEVVWLHLLRLVIGASALSVGIVLASFMGGMFLGSLCFSRLVPRERDPLRVYAWLELGIAAFGLLMPLLLPAVRSVYVGLVGYGTAGIALRALIAAVLLLPPTALMGATLPAVARLYAPDRRGLSGLASLYSANTIGAVLGSLVSAFYLLAVWDVWIATFAAVALNVAVGLYARRLAGKARTRPASTELPAEASPARRVGALAARAVLWTAGLSGLTALGAQVVWTRLLTLLFGATVYAFAIILGVFLSGLGVGSAIAAHLLKRGLNPFRGLVFSQLALIPALYLASYLLSRVLPYASPPAITPIESLHGFHVLRAFVVVFPATVFWGMSFPFALAAAGFGRGDPAEASGRVYASNTIGAIAGALAVSFWLIPSYGTRVASQALVIGAALAAALLLFAIQKEAKLSPAARRAGAARALSPAWALAFGLLAAALLPGLSKVFLAHGRYIWWVDPEDQYPYVSEGAASTVAVHVAPDGYYNFHVAGRVEATNNPNDLRLERLLGHLSALAHPQPKSVLVVGLGGGVTAGALTLHPGIERIVICEIEPRVAGAARQFAPENYEVLSSPKVELVFDDARHFLSTTDERFDIITSDPIHPWVRGNSVLFSREYYQIVRSRLLPGGIATQWVPLYETSEEAIRIQMRTFSDAFPQGTVWNSAVSGRGYDVVLLGREQPLSLDLPAIQERMREPRITQSLREVKIHDVVDLLATYATRGPDMQRWLSNTPVNRDFSLKLEYISGLALNAREADPIYDHMVAGKIFPERLFVGPPELVGQLKARITRGSRR
jgi:spermidine synthase